MNLELEHPEPLITSRLRTMSMRYWPNDCPSCGTRMEFRTQTHKRDVVAVRVCPAPNCNRVVTATEVCR